MKERSTLKIMQVWCQLCVVMLMLFSNAYAQTLPANFQRIRVTELRYIPTSFAFLPDGRILVCQKGGVLGVIRNDSLLATPAITLPVNVRGERGLLGVAVDPHFTTNQFIYLYYTDTSGPHNRLSRFTMNGDLAGSEVALIDFPTLGATIHNGGGLAFGCDGKLYVTVGENAVASNAQNLDSYMGKILRINSDGSVPAGNPFTGGPERSRIWAYGLRNPFTIAPDLVNGRLFVNDVGDSTYEEINDASIGGRNFGYPIAEGNCTANCLGLTNPLYFYDHNRNTPPPDGEGCAINGGTFFNGAISNYPATYNGRYFFLDFCGSWINYIHPRWPTRKSFGMDMGDGNTQIKQGPDGNLYYASIFSLGLFKIVYTSPPPCEAAIASANDGNLPSNVLDHHLYTRWSADGDGQWIQFCLNNPSTVNGVQIAFYKGNARTATFDILTSTDGTNFTAAATGLQSSGTKLNLETFTITPRTAKYVRIVGHGNSVNTWNSLTEVRIKTGSVVTSAREELPVVSDQITLSSYPNPFNNTNTITFTLKQLGRTQLAVFDMTGKQVAVLVNGNLQAGIHRVNFESQHLPAGVYTLKLVQAGHSVIEKVIKK